MISLPFVRIACGLILGLALTSSVAVGQIRVSTPNARHVTFAGWSLRTPLVVHLDRLAGVQCDSLMVRFESAASPTTSGTHRSTVRAEPLDEGMCQASTGWRLGNEVEEQYVNVSVLPRTTGDNYSAPFQFELLGRKVARVIFGVGFVRRSSSFSDVQVDTVRWKVGSPGDPMDPLRDTLTVAPTPLARGGMFEAVPMIGADLPFFAFEDAWTHHVRFSLAVSVTDPGDRIFAGVSLLQLPLGLSMEASPLDLHIGYAWARRTDRVASEVCDPLDPGRCNFAVAESTDWRRDGITVMGVIDATSIVTALVGMVARGG